MTLPHRAVAIGRRLARPLDVWVDRRSRQTPAVRERMLERAAVTNVIDVGAHHGEYAVCLRDAGFAGRIDSFEPIPAAFAELQRRAEDDLGWYAHGFALSDTNGTARFQVSRNEVSSSLRELTARHVSGAPDSAFDSTIFVPTSTLDDVGLDLDDGFRRSMLKLDVQGAEDLVLRGATRTLGSVVLLEIELSVVALYDGQTLYREQIDVLEQLGFDLVWIERGFVDRSLDVLLQFDGIFAKRSEFDRAGPGLDAG